MDYGSSNISAEYHAAVRDAKQTIDDLLLDIKDYETYISGGK